MMRIWVYCIVRGLDTRTFMYVMCSGKKCPPCAVIDGGIVVDFPCCKVGLARIDFA